MKSTDQKGIKSDLNFQFGNRRCSTAKKLCDSSVHSINKSANNIYVESPSILYHHLLLLIISIFCITDYSIGESSKPLNRAAIKGERVQLNCSTQDPYNGYWKYAKPFQIEERIYNGEKVVNGFKSLYSVDDSVKGQFNLIFNSWDSTSGTYVCQPDLMSVDQSAEVIVLDAQPNCSNTVASDIVNATCSINFSGNWAPEIEWHFMNGKLETNDTITIPSRKVISYLIVSFSQSDHGVLHVLTCAPKFTTEGKPQKTTATNVPEFPYSCTLTIESSTSAPSTQPTSPHPPPPPPLYIIGICFGVIACVAVTVFIVMMLYKGVKPKSDRQPNNDHTQTVPMTSQA